MANEICPGCYDGCHGECIGSGCYCDCQLMDEIFGGQHYSDGTPVDEDED